MDNLLNHLGNITIAGPCALESREQLKECATVLRQVGVKVIRASLWKPRTQPGWEGLGDEGAKILMEETVPLGLIPATEIITAEHAELLDREIQNYGKDARLLVWLGARNQNHFEQKKIAKVLAEGSGQTYLMIKNQPWDNEKHWLGILEHIINEGLPRNRLLMCHRGFSPGRQENPRSYRNLPDLDMAMRVRLKTGVPMILDPSHIGGTRERVLEILRLAKKYSFDGNIIEVHNDPENARTDKEQQLSLDLFRKTLETAKVA
ncbi:MAG: 3-deoxy-D-arabino-heptulosonate 7-phosphate (DAHP) synthase [Chlamydiales bacterium]|jgi:3-deoxy-D-arabino-heptulosonate 7-phosphate (DAHP) synthase